jgi:hypothetical protein
MYVPTNVGMHVLNRVARWYIGIFSYQKYQLGYALEGREMENVGHL